MNELERWGNRPQAIIPSRQERAHRSAIEAVIRETQETRLRLDALAAVTVHIMDRATDLDSHRRNLAGNDPTLNAVLSRIELGFAVGSERYQRNFGSRL